MKIMMKQENNNMNVIGGLYSQASRRFQRGAIKDRSRCLKATTHDAAVVCIDSGGCDN